ncbi:hypothetical protein [Agromyces humatus]|uniref:Uncharacterized protein n=1 Tax=Agromyces humatus TaxID=279573 RepID=A0ABN2L1T9_9MICO|nr:hypothetical protein [Agromyces humatus]
MSFTEHPPLPREAPDGAVARRDRLLRAIGALALVASAAVAGLGLVWLFAPESNPFGTDGMLSSEGTFLGPEVVALTAIATGLAGVVLALLATGDARPGLVTPLGFASGAIAIVMGTVFGSIGIIAIAGYLFGLLAVVAGIVTIIVTLFRRPRLGVPLLAGLAVLVAASVWIAGLTVEGVGDFATAFGSALADDAPGLLVAGVLIAAILAWSALAVIALRTRRGGRAFEAWLVRHRRVITVLAALGPLPYAVARATWLTPWPVFGPDRDAMTPDVLATGLMLGSGAVAASVLTLGLILPWGRRFPRWMPRIGGRAVPTPVAVVPGLLAAAALCISAVPMLRMIGDVDAIIDGVLLNLVLPLWFWGPMLALAVWAYAAWRGEPSRMPAATPQRQP